MCARLLTWATAAVLGACLGLTPAAGSAEEADAPGCQPMLLMGVTDGDTVYGYVDTSDPEVAVRTKLRLAGIDSPESGARAKCPEERAKGAEARSFLESLLAPALEKPTRKLVRACDIGSDKYANRRLGRHEVQIEGAWVDTGELLIARGLAFPYDGGARGRKWCLCLQSGQCPAGYQGS